MILSSCTAKTASGVLTRLQIAVAIRKSVACVAFNEFVSCSIGIGTAYLQGELGLGDDWWQNLVTKVTLLTDFQFLGEGQGRYYGGAMSVMGCTALSGFCGSLSTYGLRSVLLLWLVQSWTASGKSWQRNSHLSRSLEVITLFIFQDGH